MGFLQLKTWLLIAFCTAFYAIMFVDVPLLPKTGLWANLCQGLASKIHLNPWKHSKPKILLLFIHCCCSHYLGEGGGCVGPLFCGVVLIVLSSFTLWSF